MILVYYLCPRRFRWLILLTASYWFYGSWKPEFLILILISTGVDYIVAQQIYKQAKPFIRKAWLALSATVNIGMLGIFKYLNMFIPSKDPMLLSIFEADHLVTGEFVEAVYLTVPVGISFYTFQTLSYTIDVYRNQITPEKHLGKFALFVSFFPQLVAGPIERFSSLMPQLISPKTLSYERISNGFRLMLFGFFVKIGVADNVAPIVDGVFDQPNLFGFTNVLSASFLFGIQIYADFSGYSLIAQGVAKWFGVDLMDNFRTPYWSKSIAEFWQRWHISLSTWFRDYVFIPLGGSKVKVPRLAINIIIVFAVSGFWHGADWAFMIWGLIHGVIYLLEKALSKWIQLSKGNAIFKFFGGLKTVGIVTLAWLFFRAGSMDKVVELWQSKSVIATESIVVQPIIWVLIGVLFMFDLVLYNKRFDSWIADKPILIRHSVYGLLIGLILMFGGTADHPFIYFNF